MYSQILAAILKNGRHFNHRVLRGCIHIQYWSVGAYVLLHQILCFYSKVQGFLLSTPTMYNHHTMVAADRQWSQIFFGAQDRALVTD